MKPALTKEEWEEKETHRQDGYAGARLVEKEDESCVETGYRDFYYGDAYVGQERHGLAALCLHNQPFGFTREDVKLLRAFANLCTSDFRNLADRISALLPPEEE